MNTDYNNNVVTCHLSMRYGEEKWFLLTGDRHHDNKLCNWDLEKKHLEVAKYREASIIDVGDLFCAMQGRYDPRADMSQIRPEHVGPDYLNRLVNTALDFYSPFAKQFLLIGRGNHESNITNRHGVDLTSNLVHGLNSVGGNVFAGGYGGWVRLVLDVSNSIHHTINIKYFHGSGGGGQATKGVPVASRQAAYYPDADVVVNGHTHDSWVVPIARERLSQRGEIYRDLMWHVRTPGYKDEYCLGENGWWVERGGNPKPLGCIWMKITSESSPKRIIIEMVQDLE